MTELEAEFEREYGYDRKTQYGQRLIMKKRSNGEYRSVVTYYTWMAFQHGKLGINPND